MDYLFILFYNVNDVTLKYLMANISNLLFAA